VQILTGKRIQRFANRVDPACVALRSDHDTIVVRGIAAKGAKFDFSPARMLFAHAPHEVSMWKDTTRTIIC
jgi:hypothetical protein